MKARLKSFLQAELTGWSSFDLFWISLSTAVLLGLSLYWKDSAVGIVSALTGVWCVILTGKGKRSSFLFGTVNVICYAYVAFHARYYGEVMLNLLYYFPMNFVGWIAWRKNMDLSTGEVVKRRLPRGRASLMYAITAAAIVLYGLILRAMGGSLPFFDSMSTVMSVAAQILCVQRLMEQWVLWIVVDIITVIMWAVNFSKGQENIAVLLMWSIYLINGLIMYVRWKKEADANAI